MKPSPSARIGRLTGSSLLGFAIGTIVGICVAYHFTTILLTAVRIPHSYARPPLPQNHTDTVFIGVLSHPRNTERRAEWRQNCLPLLRKEARQRGINFVAKFVMGRAAEKDYHRGQKIQGRRAAPDVVALGKLLFEEATLYGDVLPAATIDQYIDTMDKVITLYKHGLQLGASLIAKMDDDTCRNVTGASWDRWTQHKRPPYYYFGYYMFDGTEYKSMFGVDNTTAPFMSGATYGLSGNLSQLIFEHDYVRTTQHHVYATSAEDATVGKLVSYAEKRYLEPKNIICFSVPSNTV